ncbi:MAG: LysE family transporter [Dethiobacteria bacterium]|jgi:threonine/homoserine/homoserine lactone efflux protein
MLELNLIFTTALLVGFSGAVMPGPLTAVTVEHALRRGYPAAPLVTLGHALLEVVMVILLLVGLGNYLARPSVTGVIGVAGGLVLAWMGFDMIKNAAGSTLLLESSSGDGQRARSPFWGGLIATASNPYWFLWWATIGAGYVVHSQNYGISGALFFFSGHILADFIWLSLLAVALVSGKRWLTDRFYQGIIFGLGLFLCAFSLYFFWSGLQMLSGG